LGDGPTGNLQVCFLSLLFIENIVVRKPGRCQHRGIEFPDKYDRYRTDFGFNAQSSHSTAPSFLPNSSAQKSARPVQPFGAYPTAGTQAAAARAF